MPSKRTNEKEINFDKNFLYLSPNSNLVVELYTHLVPGDAFFLSIESTATNKIIKVHQQ